MFRCELCYLNRFFKSLNDSCYGFCMNYFQRFYIFKYNFSGENVLFLEREWNYLKVKCEFVLNGANKVYQYYLFFNFNFFTELVYSFGY